MGGRHRRHRRGQPRTAIHTGSHFEYGALHAKYHCIAELNPRADEHSRKSPSPCSDDIRLLHWQDQAHVPEGQEDG